MQKGEGPKARTKLRNVASDVRCAARHLHSPWKCVTVLQEMAAHPPLAVEVRYSSTRNTSTRKQDYLDERSGFTPISRTSPVSTGSCTKRPGHKASHLTFDGCTDAWEVVCVHMRKP